MSGTPTVTARRTIALPLGRTLEIVAIGDVRVHVDTWLRMRNSAGDIVGQFWLKPDALRSVARELVGLAGELGVSP